MKKIGEILYEEKGLIEKEQRNLSITKQSLTKSSNFKLKENKKSCC